ncbi:MAG: peptidylprolyl isomerase [Pseudomonadota bacterium]|nr:peptidylprolyl isomerase [Pseudomonadota bacterium]
MNIVATAAFSLSLLAAAPVVAQTPSGDWRTVAPENLLVIDTAKGRILVEMEPRMSPLSVERVRTLADQGFYDGLKFHRVIPNFMAQTGDPLGTGEGGSELPDVAAEFEFRRGRDIGFVPVAPTPRGQSGLVGSMPVVTQPDAQMMVTADFKTGAQGLFCGGVVGMARASTPDSANSQFFLMTGIKESLNGMYTPFGRVLDGYEAVRALEAGLENENGRVVNPDVMMRARTAAAMPEGERPVVRVMTGAALEAEVARVRADRGAAFNICDVEPPVEVAGG